MMQSPSPTFEPGQARLSEPLLTKTSKSLNLNEFFPASELVVPKPHSAPVPIAEHKKSFFRLKWPEPPKPEELTATTGRHEPKSPIMLALENRSEFLFSTTPKRMRNTSQSFDSGKPAGKELVDTKKIESVDKLQAMGVGK